MKQALILAAGEGQRLRPFTVSKPKVMLSIADKPIYVTHKIFAVSLMRGVILSTVGPGASARKR